MPDWGQYILSVGLASLLVAVIGEFSDKKSSTGMLTRMICGLFLAFTVINPLTEVNFDILEAFSQSYDLDSAAAVSAGTAMAEESMRQIIKERTEAYILDKARLLNCEPDAEVVIGQDSTVPISVRITGEVPEHTRRQLEEIMEKELGISKENQEWIG